jgi:hypothetical protein
MATFTELRDMISQELSDGWVTVPLTKRDIEERSSEHVKFLISLYYNDKTLETTYYTTGNVPEAEDILGSIVLDARAVYNSNFPEFCSEFGYDSDSMKAFKIFKACKKQNKKLLNFLGEELFKQFMECEMDW